MWQLIINGPGYFDTTYQLPEGPTALGRAEENDIVLSGDLVSRKHARLILESGRLMLEDLKSRNGVKLNGKPVSALVELKVGDVLGVGENTLSVRQATEVETVATELLHVEGSGVKRVGGDKLGGAVLLARDVRESVVMRALDHISSLVPFPFDEPPAEKPADAPSYETLVVLYKTAERLVHAPSLQVFLDETVDQLIACAGATTAVVLHRDASSALTPLVVRHQGSLSRGEVPVSDAIVHEALKTGKALVVSNARHDHRFSSRESVMTYAAEQVICVPLGASDPFRGVLYLNTRAHSSEGLETLLELCTAVGHLLSSGVETFGSHAKGSGEERLRRVLERAHPGELVERKIAAVRNGAPALGLSPSLATVLLVEVALPLEVPPAAAGLLEAFHQKASGFIFSCEGSVESVRGTGLRAVFGATSEQREGDPQRAVRAALAVKAEWTRICVAAGTFIELKMAVSTGSLLAGVVGGARHDFVLAGEAVSIAEGLLASVAPGQILLDSRTAGALGSRFGVDTAGDRVLAAHGVTIPAFRLLAEDVGAFTNPGVPPRLPRSQKGAAAAE